MIELTQKQKQSLLQPCNKTQQLVPALGWLCTTQALESSIGRSSWGMTNNMQNDCPGHVERVCRTGSSTATPTPLSKKGKSGLYSLILQLGRLERNEYSFLLKGTAIVLKCLDCKG